MNVYPSACLNLKREKYTSRNQEINVSLPIYQQNISAETANKPDTGASFHDVDTCLLRSGLRISADFIQITEQQTDGNDFKHY